MEEKKKVAIFDVDGTIFRSSLFVELVDVLIEEGIFPKSTRADYESAYRAWHERKGGYDEFIMSAVDSFLEHIRGVRYEDMERAAKLTIAREKDRVYVYTRDLVRQLKQDGYYLLAISQSPKLVLEGFCKNLGFDKVYGRIYEVGPNDQFTGGIDNLHLIANKANIVKRAVEKENLTLEGSIGVGDTDGDIPLLEIVERPICFNPNSTLYKHAKRNGWKIVVERKDVIYEM
jgi:HAD superfamily hydrolase (TIGR01490 family)